MLTRDAEKNLVERARQGEVEAFMELVKKYEQPIYSLIYRMTGNREDAKDLTQETFIKAYEGLKKFRLKSSFHTWVHQIAVNHTLNFLKKNRKQRKNFEYLDGRLNDGGWKEPKVSSTEEASIEDELRIKMDQAIAELPLTYKTAFSLVIFQGMSHAEAARVLGCSEGTVSWKVHEARKILREKLRPYLGFIKEV